MKYQHREPIVSWLDQHLYMASTVIPTTICTLELWKQNLINELILSCKTSHTFQYPLSSTMKLTQNRYFPSFYKNWRSKTKVAVLPNYWTSVLNAGSYFLREAAIFSKETGPIIEAVLKHCKISIQKVPYFLTKMRVCTHKFVCYLSSTVSTETRKESMNQRSVEARISSGN